MYENFGFTDNIFNTKPLGLSQADLERFVGRVKDIENFSIDLASDDSANIIVTGYRGVGKTSFVNIMEYGTGFDKNFLKTYSRVSIPKLIPCYHKVQLEPDDKVKSVLLKSLISLLFSIRKFASENKITLKKIPKPIPDLIKWVSELETLGYSGQVSIMGFGGGGSRSTQHKNISEIPSDILQEKIRKTVEVVKDFFPVKGTLLNINNVDIISEKFLYDLFNQLRDYLFNIDGLWNVIIGQPGLYSSLSQQAARVSEIISGQETLLDPLSEEEVIEVLKVRREIYSKNKGKSPDLPIEEELIRKIYKHSDGEIRQVLKACDGIVRIVFKHNPNTKVVSSKAGFSILKNILEQQLSLSNLKAKEKEMIRIVLEKGSLRPKDYREVNLKSSVDFTNKALPLLARNFLKKEVKGNTANYKATGVITLAKFVGINI